MDIITKIASNELQLIARILDYLSLEDLIRVDFVCNTWREILEDSLKYYTFKINLAIDRIKCNFALSSIKLTKGLGRLQAPDSNIEKRVKIDKKY